MTLVLTCLTEEYVVQVSDRRLTIAGGTDAQAKIADDARNKAVFLDHRFIVGFTGLADLTRQHQRADLWLAEHLQATAGLPFEVRLREVADALAQAVSWAPPHARPLAFVAAGYARSSTGPVRPVTFTISNFLDDKYRAIECSPNFVIHVRSLPAERDFVLMPAGAALFERHWRELNQAIRSARKRQVGPIEVARILAEAVFRVAKYNKRVGDRLMICTLPRHSVDRAIAGGEAFVSGGIRLNPDEPSFFYLGPETSELIQFGPTIVSPGQIVSNIEMRFGTEANPAEPPPDIAAIHYQGPEGTKTPDDAPCPCGSGKQYKGCHNMT